jgi:hypothetical protein
VASALDLDQLRLATRCPFDEAPSGRFRTGPSRPFIWRWTKRMTIREERLWRLSRWQAGSHRRQDWQEGQADEAAERETGTNQKAGAGANETTRQGTATTSKPQAPDEASLASSAMRIASQRSTGRSGKAGRTKGTHRVQRISITARWRCVATAIRLALNTR